MTVLVQPFHDRLWDVIDSRLDDPLLNVDELARSLGVSRRHLLRQSVLHTGDVPSELLRKRRLQLAHALIEQGGFCQVRDVAVRVGMTPKYLSRVYRQRFGEPPRQAIRRRRVTVGVLPPPPLATASLQ
jgi:transcriptional regulator GlxA family with amidase domain